MVVVGLMKGMCLHSCGFMSTLLVNAVSACGNRERLRPVLHKRRGQVSCGGERLYTSKSLVMGLHVWVLSNGYFN